MVDHEYLVGVHDVHRQDERPQRVVGDPPAGVAQDVGVADLEVEHAEHVEPRVHAGDDHQPLAGRGRQVEHRNRVDLAAAVHGRDDMEATGRCQRPPVTTTAIAIAHRSPPRRSVTESVE